MTDVVVEARDRFDGRRQDDSLLDGQALEATLRLVSRGGRALEVVGRWRVERRDVELHDPATTRPAGLAVAGVDEQPAQPRLEPVGLADRPAMDPGG